jgi:primosomal replication protein N
LSQLVGAVVEVSGTVQKRVKRDGQCKLVIQPGASVPGFVVFADCRSDAETVTARKIRKGSVVSVRGKFSTFGAVAVCLVDCRLQRFAILKKENGKPCKTLLSSKKKTSKTEHLKT